MSLNVNRNVSDAFYRYKMPKLLAKVEGKGNGIKTVIVNMVEIAKALGRPPTYPTKYFGCELGAQTQFDFKDERFIVNGSHEASKLQDLLDGFIKKFVLCPECDNPETNLAVQAKKSTLSQTCIACGYSGIIKGGHRLITYIIKNPPGVNPASQGASLTKGKRLRTTKKTNDDSNGDGSSPRNEDEDDCTDSCEPNAHRDDDEDWGVDVSEDAVRARQQELSEGVKSLAVTEDSEKPEKQRLDVFYKFLESKMRDGGKLDDKEILSEADRLDVRAKSALILAELLFDHQVLSQIKTHRVILLRFCHENLKCQKYLIGGIEQVIKLHKEELLPKVPLILKALYDLDIVEEEVLIEWHSKISKKYVSKELSLEIHGKAEPFIKWLKEAEEEEEDDDDGEDDDVEIEYDDRARISSIQQQTETVSPHSAPINLQQGNVKPDEEVDIDAI